jgi:hypothetical protein
MVFEEACVEQLQALSTCSLVPPRSTLALADQLSGEVRRCGPGTHPNTYPTRETARPPVTQGAGRRARTSSGVDSRGTWGRQKLYG